MATLQTNRGSYNTLTGGQTSRQVIDMAETIDQTEADKMPFLVFTKAGLGRRTAHNWKFEWFQDTPVKHIDTLNGSIASGGTTLVVDDYTLWLANDLWMDMANFDICKVSTTPTTSSVTVAWQTTPSSGVADATEFVNIGSACAEGSDYPAPRSTKETALYNYLQIQKDTVGMTEIQQATKMYGGDDWAYQAKKLMPMHARKLERQHIFGYRKLTAAADGIGYIGMSNGLKRWITTNTDTSFGTLSVSTLATVARTCREFDMSESIKLVMFTTLAVQSKISQLWNDGNQIKTGAKMAGVNITSVILPGLDYPLTIVAHPELIAISAMGDAAFVVGMLPERMKYVTMAGLDTHMRVNLQDNDTDIRIDGLYTCSGLECHWEAMHYYLDGITV